MGNRSAEGTAPVTLQVAPQWLLCTLPREASSARPTGGELVDHGILVAEALRDGPGAATKRFNRRRARSVDESAIACESPRSATDLEMKYVLIYEATPDFMTKVPLHIAAHRALWPRYAADGRLLMIGPFVDEPRGGALAVFTSREAAQSFAGEDPFVTGGVVARWTIREWAEALVPEPQTSA